MSQKIVTFDNEGRLLRSNLQNTQIIMYGDNNINDIRNLAPLVDILKENFFNKFVVNSEHSFQIDGFFVGNKITFTDGISTIVVSTIMRSDNISVTLNSCETIDVLLSMIDFINSTSGYYYNYVSIKCSKEHIDTFFQNGFHLDESSSEEILMKSLCNQVGCY